MFKKLINNILLFLQPYWVYLFPGFKSRFLYHRKFSKPLDLDNPKGLNEKLMGIKLTDYKHNALVTKCTDKFLVRDYLAGLGLADILTKLFGVWDRPEDINWDELPHQFVLKANHGCRYNIICEDKNQLDRKEATLKLRQWLKEDFWKKLEEYNYRGIPKKIICEEFLDDGTGQLPVDYKFYCYHGVAEYVMLCIGRKINANIFHYFDRNWNYTKLHITKPPTTTIPKPKEMDEMFKIADQLSKPFKFVRVDLYNVNGRIVFGELTFTPSACLETLTEEGNIILGKKLEIGF